MHGKNSNFSSIGVEHDTHGLVNCSNHDCQYIYETVQRYLRKILHDAHHVPTFYSSATTTTHFPKLCPFSTSTSACAEFSSPRTRNSLYLISPLASRAGNVRKNSSSHLGSSDATRKPWIVTSRQSICCRFLTLYGSFVLYDEIIPQLWQRKVSAGNVVGEREELVFVR